MDNDLKYFLLVAEELNVSRAAKKAYVSQQYMSKVIKNLEVKYNVELFKRKPVFTLTLAGEILRNFAQGELARKESLQIQLNALKNEEKGTLTFGCGVNRGLGLLPEVLPDFMAAFPNVDVSVKYAMTSVLTKMAVNGFVDVFLGVGFKNAFPSLAETPLCREKVYVAVADSVLMRYFPSDYPECKIRFSQGVDLHEFQDIPFCINGNDTNTAAYVHNYFQEKDIRMKHLLTIDGNRLHIRLAAKGCCACFCRAMLLKRAQSLYKQGNYQKLNIFPVQDFEKYYYPISLVYRKDAVKSAALKYFIGRIQKYYFDEYVSVPEYN